MTGPQRRAGAQELAAAAQAAGVADRRVLEAIGSTPRERFVPAEHAGLAYRDEPVPIAHGQVTSQPSLVATMVAALSLAGGEKVLEVGTGYGYQTALLARLTAQVVSVEFWPDMAAAARRNLAGQGLGNVTVIAGDGSQGAAGHAPFDAIIISAAFPKVPPPLTGQLAAGGRLVQPIGPGGDENVALYRRTGSGLARVKILTPASFVPLYGRHGYPAPPTRVPEAQPARVPDSNRMGGHRLGRANLVHRNETPRAREDLAREDYHDPTAGIAGAPPARSALTLRLILASFGLLACTASAALLVIVASQPVIAAIFAFLAAVAAADIAVVTRRKLRGEPG